MEVPNEGFMESSIILWIRFCVTRSDLLSSPCDGNVMVVEKREASWCRSCRQCVPSPR